jgi:hypothetical protein
MDDCRRFAIKLLSYLETLFVFRCFTVFHLRNAELGGIVMWCLLPVAMVLGTPLLCMAQARATAWGQEATFDGYNIEVRFNEENGRNGSMHAPVNMLDVNGAKVCADCNGGPYIEFNCSNGIQCASGSMKYTGLVIVGEGEKLNQNPTVNDSIITVVCSSVSECEEFLRAVRTSGQATQNPTDSNAYRRPSASSTPAPPAQEPVIDGSRIPSQINFNKDNQSTSKPAVQDGPKPLFEDLGREYLGTKITATDDGNKKLTSLFDSLAKQPPVIYESQIRNTSPVDYSTEVEKYGAGLFDDARKGQIENFTDPLRSVARQWFMEQYDQMSRDTTSRSLSGQSFDELPEAFRKDYLVWEAGVKRIFEPFSLRGGLKLVDAFGSLFDLWKEP